MDKTYLKEQDATKSDDPVLIGAFDSHFFHKFVVDTLAIAVLIVVLMV